MTTHEFNKLQKGLQKYAKDIADYAGEDLIKLAVGAYGSSASGVSPASSPAGGGHGGTFRQGLTNVQDAFKHTGDAIYNNALAPAGNAIQNNVLTPTWNKALVPAYNALAPAGNTVWNNGGNRVWNNYGGKELGNRLYQGGVNTLNAGFNTLHGVSTTGLGAAHTIAGGIGSTGSAAWQLGARASDALGQTSDATSMADAFAGPYNKAFVAGLKDTAGGTLDTLSGGNFNYDGTPVLGGPATAPHPGTAVEGLNSDIRAQLGHGTEDERLFRNINGITSFASDTAAFGGAFKALKLLPSWLARATAAPTAARTIAPAVSSATAAPAVSSATAAPAVSSATAAPAVSAATAAPTAAAARTIAPAVSSATAAPAVSSATAAPAVSAVTTPAVVPSVVAKVPKAVADMTTQTPMQYVAAAGTVGLTDDVANATTAYAEASNPSDRPADYKAYVEEMSNATPEQRTAVEQKLVPLVSEQVKTTAAPEQVQAVQAIAQNPNSPAARQAVELGRSSFATEQAGGDPTKLQDPEFFGSVMGAWNGLGTPGQMAFMLGVPMALIGLLSGDGLTGILGGLGISGLALGAGATGMFGDQAQAATGKFMGDVGNFMGMIPDEARDASNFNEAAAQKTKDRIAEAMTAAPLATRKAPGQGAQIGQQMLTAERAKFEPLRNLYKINPQSAYSMLMGMKNGPQTTAEAAKLYEQLNTKYDATGQEGFLYGQTLDNIRQRQQNPQTWTDRVMGLSTPESILQSMGFQIPAAQTQKGASVNIAQQIFFKQAAQKAARCWAGYAPVPGKAPYSDNSCRPKRKKKTEKKAEEYSAQPFNPAIGYPPKSGMTPMQHYRNQMYLSGREVAKNLNNPKPKWSNNYLFAKRHYGEDANGNILMPRAPVSPGQMAAPVAPAQPRLAPPAPINSGSRNYDVVSPPAPM